MLRVLCACTTCELTSIPLSVMQSTMRATHVDTCRLCKIKRTWNMEGDQALYTHTCLIVNDSTVMPTTVHRLVNDTYLSRVDTIRCTRCRNSNTLHDVSNLPQSHTDCADRIVFRVDHRDPETAIIDSMRGGNARVQHSKLYIAWKSDIFSETIGLPCDDSSTALYKVP